MRLAITANGPGEVAGWVRPLLRSIYARAPDTEVHLFLVPDDYATGGEARMARDLFPGAHVHDPKAYVRFALGQSAPGMPKSADAVQYMGGDLMHAARLHKRLGGIATTYKFSKRRYRELFAKAFAVDDRNVEDLLSAGTPRERIEKIGNLAIDGALLEAQAPVEAAAPLDGVLFMPGSRAYEVENMLPFFFTVAVRMVREQPNLPIAFGLSPFTDLAQVSDAIARGAIPQLYSQRGRLIETADGAALETLDGSLRFPILRNALAAATKARLVVTMPGTKCIELATLGVPIVALTPLNAPEKVTFNGPFTYLDRIPFVGAPLKRAVAVRVSRSFKYHTQPNIDTQEMLIREVHGTVTPGRIARLVLETFMDRSWLSTSSERLRGLYRDHVGAADRMAEALLSGK